MAELVLDLTGRTGLSDDFFGDEDMITPAPNTRIGTAQTDITSGYFNPYLRKGYLAPTTSTSTTLTFDTGPTTVLGSVEYDAVNDKVYWADRLKAVFGGSDLNDTSITFIDDLVDGTFPAQKYDELHDLQMYQLNGTRVLYFVGKGLPTATTNAVKTIAYASTTGVTRIATAVAVNPIASTQPTITANVRDFQSASGTTSTVAFTVPSSTNRALIVMAYWPSNAAAPSATWNGTSMTTENTSSNGPSCRVFKMANPTATSNNIVVTWGTAQTNRLVYAFVVDSTEQTEIIRVNSFRELGGSTQAEVNIRPPYININQLLIGACYVNGTITAATDNGTEYYNTTNAYGADGLWKRNDSGYGLQVGYATLPVTSLGGTPGSWLLSSAVGGFTHTLNSKYAFMRTADNGFAYIFADNHVHKVDGTTTGGATGTATRDVLLFPDTFTITDAVDYRSRIYLAIHQSTVNSETTSLNTFNGKCGVYVWNRISTQLSSADFVELPGVREIKKIYTSPDGQLKLITISDRGLTELRQFGYNDSGGVVFPVFKLLGLGAHPQFPDGLTLAGDKAMWIGNDGKVYCEKEKYVTQLFEIKIPGTTTTGLASNIATGAVLFGSGVETADTGFRSNKQALTLSYKDGSTHYLKKIYPFDLKNGSNSTQVQHQGDVYTAVQLIPVTSVVRNVRIYNLPTSSSGTTTLATVKLYFNQSTTATFPSGMTKTITMNEAKRGYVDFKINNPYISSLQIEVEWSTGINLGSDTYLPNMAVVSFDDTKTQSPDNG